MNPTQTTDLISTQDILLDLLKRLFSSNEVIHCGSTIIYRGGNEKAKRVTLMFTIRSNDMRKDWYRNNIFDRVDIHLISGDYNIFKDRVEAFNSPVLSVSQATTVPETVFKLSDIIDAYREYSYNSDD